MCPLCDTEEDSNHMFFSCVLAQFRRSCFRKVIGGHWCHTNLPDLSTEIQSSPASTSHLWWLTIGVLAWMTLWMVHNKHVIQCVPLSHGTDDVFKMCGYLQLWR